MGRRCRQAGAETVEFALTLFLFFFLLFIIIDFLLAVYDHGTVVNASRVGARQGSLYWVNPDTHDRNASPAQNTSLSESMISSAVDAYLTPLMNPGSASDIAPAFSVFIPPATNITLNSGDIRRPVSRATVTVDVQFDYVGFTRLPGVAGITLRGTTQTLVEPVM
jgi:Flp pilus assembly protein TadG